MTAKPTPETPLPNHDAPEQDAVEFEDTSGDDIIEPFNPALIRVETKPLIVAALLARIEHDEIDLKPEFQRKGGIWTEGAQSRLIESLLIRIPIPAFYVDASDDDRWLVVDGLQRMTTLKRFALDKSMKLVGLEFLKELEGKTFADLPRTFQRRIEETNLTFYVIDKGTPPEVKYLVFRRINTGGLPLSPQEIRHALNPGPVTDLLLQMSQSEDFLIATARSISQDRMADREFCLRFAAFAITDYKTYSTRDDLDTFLNAAMNNLNNLGIGAHQELYTRFNRAMLAAFHIFGRHAFRKQHVRDGWRHPINKALFESWSVSLDKCSDHQLSKLVAKKDRLNELFIEYLNNDLEFVDSVSQSTGSVRKVKKRFSTIEQLVDRALRADIS